MNIKYKDFYKEELREVFNRVYPYIKVEDRSGDKVYKFKTDGGEEYRVELNRSTASTMEMYRRDILKGYDFDMVISVSFNKLTTKAGSDPYGIVGSDDVWGVFSTVMKIVRDNVSDSDVIKFIAVEPSRVKLYDHLIKRFKRSGDVLVKGKTLFDDSGTLYLLVPTVKNTSTTTNEGVIEEIFNTIYPYKHEVSSRYGNVYKFTTPSGELYEVFINDRDMDDLISEYPDKTIDILKGIIEEGETVTEIIFAKRVGGYLKYTKDESEDVWGVFSTILKIINDNIKRRDVVIFSAHGGSRQKLYDRMVNSFNRGRYDVYNDIDQDGGKIYLMIPKGKIVQ